MQVNFMFKSNCHTHTTYCDGKNTAAEMAESAYKNGFVSLGFSGHSPMKNENEWTMTAEALKSYKAEIKELKQEYKGKMDILCGIELDADYSDVNPDEFDFVIGAVHQLNKDGKIYDIDYTAEMLKTAVDELFNGSFNAMSKFYYNALADFIISTKADVVAHFDLITKFNVDLPLFDETDADYRNYALEAVDRILSAKPDILFEINTGAMFRVGKKAPYPAEFILEHIHKNGGKITLTSDSHAINSLDFAFDKALEYIRDCGFDKIYYITAEGWKEFSINLQEVK